MRSLHCKRGMKVTVKFKTGFYLPQWYVRIFTFVGKAYIRDRPLIFKYINDCLLAALMNSVRWPPQQL